ncbi:MAG TPA: hypothetical protein VNO70_14115, partial [Blastocatellia bacterium]|nr:hypothetical protein [Blastocatellia bacterium]
MLTLILLVSSFPGINFPPSVGERVAASPAGAAELAPPAPPESSGSAALAAREIHVQAGDNLQAALNSARPGDTIFLEAGATYVGNFRLPKKEGTDWITIRSAAADSALPPPGSRVSPAHAPALPKIISPNSAPALATERGAHHYRLECIEFGIAPNVMLNYGIVRLGDGGKEQNSLEVVPRDLVIDRCYIHGHPTADVSRGIALNSGQTAVINSYISECHGIGFDTQAICGWNGPGPFEIINNYLEGAGENVMFGGADPQIPNLVPSDITFRRNHCAKPLAWREGILAKPTNLLLSGVSATSSGLFIGSTYYYRVAGRGRAGFKTMATSAASDEIAVTLSVGQNAVALTWSPVALASEYRVYRTSDPPEAPARTWVYYTVTANAFTDIGDLLSVGNDSQPPERGTRWTVKNLFELKNARRVLIEGNVFENNWLDAQTGYAIVFKSANQNGGAPWTVTEDVTFTNNIVRHTGAGINVLGESSNFPSEQVKRVEISNNLFEDVDKAKWGGDGNFLKITDVTDVQVEHNTVLHTGSIILA